MLRVNRASLDEAVKAFMMCAMATTNVRGLRVMFPIKPEAAEAAVLGALSILAPGGGPVTAADVFFVSMTDDSIETWPKQVEKVNG